MVCLIVFGIERNQIRECEAIVAGHKIQARMRSAAIMQIQVAAACEARRQLADCRAVSFPKSPHAITVSTIPLAPEDRKIPDLVSIRPQIPRLGNELHLRQDRILVNDVKERSETIDIP